MLVAATAVLCLGAGASSASASSASPGLEVSADGTSFARANAQPLLPDELRVVPGDHLTARVWVRNPGRDPARLRIDLIRPSTDDVAFAAATSISAGVDGSTGSAVPLSREGDLPTCVVLSDERVLAGGETAALDLTFEVSPLIEGRRSQGSQAHVEVRGSLSTPRAPALAAGRSCAAASSGPVAADLAPTGTAAPALAVTLAAVGVLTGGAVWIIGRRARLPEDHRDDD